jgi:hypothetical protein
MAKTIPINPELHARLKQVAQRKALKMGSLVEQLIDAWLKRVDRPKRKAG